MGWFLREMKDGRQNIWIGSFMLRKTKGVI